MAQTKLSTPVMAQTKRILTRRRASEPNLPVETYKRLRNELVTDILARKPVLYYMARYLPHDLIIEILVRLPVKSVARFRCVSKDWNSSLMHPRFISEQAIRANEEPNDDLRIACIRDSSLYRLNPRIYYMLNDHINFIVAKKFALPKEKYWWRESFLYIIGSCHGLIFLKKITQNKLEGKDQEFFLLNPLTGESRELPNMVDDGKKEEFGFGYDASTKDYKIIRFQGDPCAFQVFSLKNNSWRRRLRNMIQGTPTQLPDLLSNLAVEVGGFLHWQIADPKSNSILTFDLAQERFGEITNVPKDRKDEIIGVSALQGCLCVTIKSTAVSGQGCAIWTMKEYGVAKSWTKLINLEADNLLGYNFADFRPMPICYTKDGIVLFQLQNFSKIIVYDLRNQCFRICRIPRAIVHFSSLTPYVESLVSPKSL